ncbi:hypothetical protein [Microbulbifer agarilyticus]|uniref:hypothetical protein n=1 Tax=Microbulbifer agarilyticus TaxID=260552 RepID=UPI001CD2F5FE|nr:hypothetical protein [Microbulbifer agarilyticus]MCA0894583.1 hypothetical protein [Microbulbifer agarilyticus]
MSAPTSPLPLSAQNTSLIAGRNAGKPIRCTTEYQESFEKLQRAANRGHHWARMAIKELNALTTGMLGKNNVYVRPGERQLSTGNEKYYVFLPGLKATVVRWPNDQFCITQLVMDDNYYQIDGQGGEQMGMYRVSKSRSGNWQSKYVDGGNVKPQSGRVVTVSDAKFRNADDAAAASVPGALDALGNNTFAVRSSGCDLHFTPGRQRLGGLSCYNPLTVDRSRASALYLAKSMEKAKNIEHISWISDFGGSAVLTQAMQILVDKGVTLEGHTVYLHRPRTSPAKALRLAHKLRLELNKEFADTGANLVGALSQFSVAGQRINSKLDPYDRDYHARKWLKRIVAVSTPVGVAGAVAVGPTGAMLGGIATVIGGAGAAFALGQSVTKDVRHKLHR